MLSRPAGNEQDNPQFAEQVAAMERRAKLLGLAPRSLHYLFPNNPGPHNATDADAASALGLGSNIAIDLHTSSSGETVFITKGVQFSIERLSQKKTCQLA
jgi:hypothetical protein